jgi:predicted small lipoprotein YifL
MNHKILVTTILVLSTALTGCNDKMPEQLPRSTDDIETPTEATKATSSVPEAAHLSPFSGDLSSAGKVDLCAMDSVNGLVATSGSFRVPVNEPVALEGWAATTSLTVPTTITVVMSSPSGAFQVSGNTGIPRQDVARAYKASALATAGFKLQIPKADMPSGQYELAILHDEGGSPVSCASPIKLSLQ